MSIGSVKDYGLSLGQVVVDEENRRTKISQKVAGIDIQEYMDGIKKVKEAEIKPYQEKIDKNTKIQAALSLYKSKLDDLQSKVSVLTNDVSVYNSSVDSVFNAKAVTASMAGGDASSVVNFSALPEANIGSFKLVVSQLAQSDLRQGSFSTSDLNAAMGITGNFTISTPVANSSATISITSTMSANQILAAINNASKTTGVSAELSMVTGGSTQTYAMKLKCQNTGAPIILADTSGTPLEALGLNLTAGNYPTGVMNYQAGILTVANQTTALALSGTLNVSVAGGTNAPISITAGMTLQDVVNAINAQQGTTGVQASYDLAYYNPANLATPESFQIKLSAVDPTKTVVLSDAGGVMAGLGLTNLVTDYQTLVSKVTCDGQAYVRQSNTISDVITGVSFDLLATSSQPIMGNISYDKSKVAVAITDFLTSYNNLATFFNEQTKSTTESDKYSTQTILKAAEGADLFGNMFVKNSFLDIKSSLMGAVPGTSLTINSLYAMGISIQSDGTLNLVDEKAYQGAIDNNFPDLKTLFGNMASFTDTRFALTKMPPILPASVGGKNVTLTLATDALSNTTASFAVGAVAYTGTVTPTASGFSISVVTDPNTPVSDQPLAGVTVNFFGTMAPNTTLTPTMVITQGKASQLGNIALSLTNDALDPNDKSGNTKTGLYFKELDRIKGLSSKEEKVIEQRKKRADLEVARLEKQFSRAYQASIKLEEISTILESLLKARH